MGKEQFTGAWQLVSSGFRGDDGKVTYPWGKNAAGQIIYDTEGFLSAHIMQTNRPKFVSKDQMKGTPDEIKSAFEGYMAYYGTYEIDETQKLVTHHVRGSLFPNLVGVGLKRFYEFSGNRLILSTPPMWMAGEKTVGVLVWERAR